MTRKQIIKSIETATRNAANYERKMWAYIERRNKAIAALNAKGVNIATTNFIVDTTNSYFPQVSLMAKINNPHCTFEAIYRITNNWEYALRNERNAESEMRIITKLNAELAAMDAAERQENNMAEIMENAMADFKAYWVEKMTAWHKAHHAYINGILAETIARYKRIKAIRNEMCRYYGFWMCRTKAAIAKKEHGKTYNRLENAIKFATEIIMDEAAGKTESEYMAKASEMINAEWKHNMAVLCEKLERFAIDMDNIKVNATATTSKGFECIITDGTARYINARMIWAAEYSELVSPHTRYIVTEKKTK